MNIGIVGLGFVGAVNLVLFSSKMAEEENSDFRVIGVDRPGKVGDRMKSSFKSGRFWIESRDSALDRQFAKICCDTRVSVSTNLADLSECDVIVVCINLDVTGLEEATFECDLRSFEKVVEKLFGLVKSSCLIVIESTVPPGFCCNRLFPMAAKIFKQRGMQTSPLLAHCYERIMPGARYLESVREEGRVLSGINDESKLRAFEFYKYILGNDAEITIADNTQTSELAKISENTYRALTIALVGELQIIAKALGANLNQVSEVVGARESHSNFRKPGLGIGGYCLPKDPAFLTVADREFKLGLSDLGLSKLVVSYRARMNQTCLEYLLDAIGSTTVENEIIFWGISYKNDVSDLRSSSAKDLMLMLSAHVDKLFWFDPIVSKEDFLELEKWSERSVQNIDCLIAAVRHVDDTLLEFCYDHLNRGALIIDINNTLAPNEISSLRANDFVVRIFGEFIS